MSFYDLIIENRDFDFPSFWQTCGEGEVKRALLKDRLSKEDLLALLSPAAGDLLEEMAVKARQLTQQHFGKVIFLYAPLYLADYCQNYCTYCGFSAKNPFPRRALTLEEVRREALVIAVSGIKHLLVLTGEARKASSLSYIKECLQMLTGSFASVSAEIYPLTVEEYCELVQTGLDGVTIYQEVYDEGVYREVHPRGPKSNYRLRLDTPERVCLAGVRTLNIGALLGLNYWRKEAFWTACHAAYLQDKFPAVELSLSLPRLQPHLGSFIPQAPVNDRELVQILLAFRLYLPRVGITISTRERAGLRDNLVGLGVTRMSAGSCTVVGGYSGQGGTGQFEIADVRKAPEIKEMIIKKGYQPVFTDWTGAPSKRMMEPGGIYL